MKTRKKMPVTEKPTTAQLEAELKRERYKSRYHSTFRSTVNTLVVVAAVAVLVASLWMPVLRIYGSSMTPTLSNGEIVVSLKSSEFAQGDVLAFYVGNKVLIKRVIAGPGDWVDIKEDGTVYVNNVALDEPYLTEKAFGACNIELPYQVPDQRWFVMGDHRSVSVDSRNTEIGCIAEEQIVGKIVLRLWPLGDFGVLQ